MIAESRSRMTVSALEEIGEHRLVDALGRRAAAEELEDGAERVGVALRR